jgi:hypothetical protein
MNSPSFELKDEVCCAGCGPAIGRTGHRLARDQSADLLPSRAFEKADIAFGDRVLTKGNLPNLL